MPGRRLNDHELALIQFWSEPPEGFDQPLLKSVTIEGPPTIRGIERIRVPFDYPMTALCGRNGVGKSTILALAAFSSGKPNDWTVAPWPTSPSRNQPKSTAYAWKDFFFRHHSDPQYDGLKVRFAYSLKGNDIELVRRWENSRWKTLPDPGRSRPLTFPKRPIEFVSLARILPPSELQHLRRQFGQTQMTDIVGLSADMCNCLSEIFRQDYQQVEIHEAGGVSLARCVAGANYSGFDMGAGENALITMLYRLQRLPLGGLLIIEEIEHGLHPEAQSVLIDELTKIVKAKRQQIIFTTHSEHVLDRLPQEGRVLLECVAGQHRAISAPTTRLALANMTGIPQPEATIFVEDEFAAALTAHAIPRELRTRVRILPIGSSSKLATQLAAHRRAENPGPAKCLFDADCRQAEIEGWLRSEELPEDETSYAFLPGDNLPPEKWVLNAVRDEAHLMKFAAVFGFDREEAQEEIERLLALRNHHNIPFELAQRVALSEKEVLTMMVAAVAPEHEDFGALRETVRQLLQPQGNG